MNRYKIILICIACIFVALPTALALPGVASQQGRAATIVRNPPDNLILDLKPNQRLRSDAVEHAKQMNDETLRAELSNILDRIRAVEQWAGFIHAYELQLRESDQKRYREWDELTDGSVSLLFITANSSAASILHDLKKPNLPRDYAINQYAENMSMIDQLEAYRLHVGKAALTNLLDVQPNHVLLESWD